MGKPKWRRFEDLAASIQRELSPEARIEQNERVVGRRSGRSREIDIAVYQSVGQYELFIAIDCKDHRRKVNVKDVESFMGLVDDVGANQAAIVSQRGFTAAASQRAADGGIRCFRLIDTEESDWKSCLAIPAVARVLELSTFRLCFSGQSEFALSPPAGELGLSPVLRSDGSPIGSVRDLLLGRWSSGEIPTTPGEHKGLSLTDEETFMAGEGSLEPVRLSVDVVVIEQRFFGYIPVSETRGFADEVRGGLHAREMRTGPISVNVVEAGWTPIASDTQLAVEPVLQLEMFKIPDRIELTEPAGAGSSLDRP